ncbi:MAG: hypothetical protein KGS60_12725 [Verrucomicrobia bacterium]|nr:hypothetical protein [Verrucomicrobiota bacterium]
MKTILLTGSVICGLMISGQAQVGKKSAGDPRVGVLLDQAGLKFTVDPEGDFRLHNEVSDGRSQLIWILSKTSGLGDLEIREVWSIAFKSPEPFSAKVGHLLLEQNGQTKIGAWQMRKMGDDFAAVFSAQIAADTDVDSLVTVIQAVAETADDMEEELSEGDDW